VTHTKGVTTYKDNLNVESVGNFHYHGGGVTGAEFKKLFDTDALEAKLHAIPCEKITVYGESYGGKMQANQWRYGEKLKFIAFDVCLDDKWLTVPEAEKLVLSLGLEFVHYVRISTKLSEVDFWRDAISEQAIRNGVVTMLPNGFGYGPSRFVRREGIVLRPINEEVDFRGNRICAKHKRAEERETKTERVVDLAKLEVLKEARAISEEWATLTRLQHVIDKIPGAVIDMTRTREVISAMIADIHREGEGEFEPGPTVNAEIGKRTSQLLKQYLSEKLKESQA
jgi:hypothetical protein